MSDVQRYRWNKNHSITEEDCVKASDYDALLREVEIEREYSRKLSGWLEDAKIAAGGRIALERQVAEAKQRIAELEKENVELLHCGLKEAEAYDKVKEWLVEVVELVQAVIFSASRDSFGETTRWMVGDDELKVLRQRIEILVKAQKEGI